MGLLRANYQLAEKGKAAFSKNIFCFVLGHIWMHEANITVADFISFCKLVLFLPHSLRNPCHFSSVSSVLFCSCRGYWRILFMCVSHVMHIRALWHHLSQDVPSKTPILSRLVAWSHRVAARIWCSQFQKRLSALLPLKICAKSIFDWTCSFVAVNVKL